MTATPNDSRPVVWPWRVLKLFRSVALCAALAAAIVILPEHFVFSIELHPASPKLRPRISTTGHLGGGSGTILLRFTMMESVSTRDYYVHLRVLRVLLRNLSDDRCQLSVQILDDISGLSISDNGNDPTQRDLCFHRLVNDLLKRDVEEAEFIKARNQEAELTYAWPEPSPGSSTMAILAAERLAYLKIYDRGSVLHQLHSVGKEDFATISFGRFSEWLRRNRDEKLVAWAGPVSLLRALGLSDGGAFSPYSLTSLRRSSSELAYDGQRFGIAALIMISLELDYASTRLSEAEAWKLFSCGARSARTRPETARATSDVSCFSHSMFMIHSWFGLAIRMRDGSDLADFCREVRELARQDEIVSLVQLTPEKSRGLYVLLPPGCVREL